MSKEQQEAVSTAAIAEGDEPIAKVSINKYDPFQLKGSIDDEICYVSLSRSLINYCS